MTNEPLVPDEDRDVPLDEPLEDPDMDGVDSLRDIEAEEGDEQGLEDLYDLDELEAEELGVDLDATQPDEPPLD